MNHQNTKAPNEACVCGGRLKSQDVTHAPAGCSDSAGTVLPIQPDPARGPFIFDPQGRPVCLLDPRPEDVHPEVIAHSLALQCRYGGHCPRFLSVAEHSLLVAEVVAREHPELALAALLHDAAEAYVGDWPSPLKKRVLIDQRPYGSTIPIGACPPQHIEQLEDRWAQAIVERFGLPLEHWPHIATDAHFVIRAADLAVGAAEMLSFGWSGPTPGRESAPAEGIEILHLSPQEAEFQFLLRLASLFGWESHWAHRGTERMGRFIEQALAQRAGSSPAPPAGSDARPTEEAQP